MPITEPVRVLCVDLLVALRQLGQAEVEHLDEVGVAAAVDEEDVLGLEVAVDDPVRVRGVSASAIWAPM